MCIFFLLAGLEKFPALGWGLNFRKPFVFFGRGGFLWAEHGRACKSPVAVNWAGKLIAASPRGWGCPARPNFALFSALPAAKIHVTQVGALAVCQPQEEIPPCALWS